MYKPAIKWTKSSKIKKRVKAPYWTNKKLLEISTIEQALEDYIYGFSTSFDGDKHKVICGNICYNCNEQIEQYREKSKRFADYICNDCLYNILTKFKTL